MNYLEVSINVFTGQRRQLAYEWFFNYIKCIQIPKNMKLVELSSYRMRMS
jgi:hypothetical protein